MFNIKWISTNRNIRHFVLIFFLKILLPLYTMLNITPVAQESQAIHSYLTFGWPLVAYETGHTMASQKDKLNSFFFFFPS